jgi:hypothetical protein
MSNGTATHRATDRPGPREETAIPDEELRRLLLDLGSARQWAEEGRVSLGYAIMLRGMTRAERALLAGDPWAAELMRCWRASLDDFCEQYGAGDDS